MSTVGLSAMIRGAEDGDNFQVKDYSEDQIETMLEEFFREWLQ